MSHLKLIFVFILRNRAGCDKTVGNPLIMPVKTSVTELSHIVSHDGQ